jgi:type IV secretory pathway TrbF-like protein/sugar phosphate permease
MDARENARLVLLVFLPFAVGFYLSYLFRTINSLISGQLMSQLALGAADLGLLTSVYFLTFAAAQVPVGVLLDRYEPRRIQSALLLIAAVGAALLGVSKEFDSLVLGRALIGIGMAGSLTAALKAVVVWFPRERVALVSGYLVMLGSFGAVTATLPVEVLLSRVGWQELFQLLAGVTAGCAIATYLMVPDRPTANRIEECRASVTLRAVYTDARFWRLAPLSATCIGTAWSLQSLWAASWLADVERLEREALVQHLFIMAVALSTSALLLGVGADWLRRRGVGPTQMLASLATLFIVCQLALIQRWPLPTHLLWALVAAVGAATVLSYSIQAEYIPRHLAGRANAALNVFHIGGAFVLQFSTGMIVQQWEAQDGHYPTIAYQTAFAVNVALQIAALLWFEVPRIQQLVSRFGSAMNRRRVCVAFPQAVLTRHAAAAAIWFRRLNFAHAETSNWRFAAFGSTALFVSLAVALAISAGHARVAIRTVEVAHLGESRDIKAATSMTAPSDAQIAFFLERLVKNIRSLSIDPVVVRANWIDAFNYVTDHAALTLSGYVREANLLTRIGLQAVRVDVVYVVRASQNSFEIVWDEQTYINGTVTNIERFRGVAEVILEAASTASTLRNPLGLYVSAFRWLREDTK